MRAERLFLVLGLADPARVEEALEVRRRRACMRESSTRPEKGFTT